MGGAKPPEPATPTTARVGGGGSARAAAVVVVLVLATTAWLGLSGGDAPPEEPAQLPPVATAAPVAGPTPAPATEPPLAPLATTPPSVPAEVGSALSVIADLPVAADGEEAYAIVGRFGDERYVTVLSAWRPDLLAGRARVPFPRPAREGTISLVHLRPDQTAGLEDIVGIWSVSLDPLVPETTRGGEVLRVSQPGRPRARNVAPLVRDGFEVSVRAEGRLSFALLVIKVASPWHQPRASACDGAPLLKRYSC